MKQCQQTGSLQLQTARATVTEHHLAGWPRVTPTLQTTLDSHAAESLGVQGAQPRCRRPGSQTPARLNSWLEAAWESTALARMLEQMLGAVVRGCQAPAALTAGELNSYFCGS